MSKGDRRRQQILDTVRALLEEGSFEEITIAEITRRANVTRPAFYFYFESKGAAVASLMEGLFSEFMAAASVWYDHAGPDQREGLRQGMGATVELWRKHAVVMYGMVQAAASDLRANEIWSEWVNAFISRAVPTISADRAGHPREAVSAEDLATFLVDATFAAMVRDVRSLVTTGMPVTSTSDTVVQVWARALYETY